MKTEARRPSSWSTFLHFVPRDRFSGVFCVRNPQFSDNSFVKKVQ